MWIHLRRALARGWAMVRERAIALGSRVSPNGERHAEACRNDVRARFWAGVHEGQREAETNSAKRNAT
jgi:hypothetical protein